MVQPFAQGNMKVRTSVLVFLKGTTAPLVLYVDNPQALYEELSLVLKQNSQTTKIIEKATLGPVKKIAVLSTQICAVALQEEPFM